MSTNQPVLWDNQRSGESADNTLAPLTTPTAERRHGMADSYLTETWKPVAGLEGRYEVSDFGRVRSLRFVNNICDKLRVAPLVLIAATDDSGHLRVAIARGRRNSYRRLVHRMVLEAFGDPCPTGYTCAHLDGDPTHNHISNLKWVTVAENMGHKKLHGTEQTGERCPSAKLTDAAVRAIRAGRAAGESLDVLALRHGVCSGTIRSVERRLTWKHVA